jgi:hypothetical protein
LSGYRPIGALFTDWKYILGVFCGKQVEKREMAFSYHSLIANHSKGLIALSLSASILVSAQRM